MSKKRKLKRRSLLKEFVAQSTAEATVDGTKLAKEEPVVESAFVWIWEAFWKLNAARPGGFGPSAIPLTEVAAYCNLFRVNSHRERSLLVHCIQAMDAEYLRLISNTTKINET